MSDHQAVKLRVAERVWAAILAAVMAATLVGCPPEPAAPPWPVEITDCPIASPASEAPPWRSVPPGGEGAGPLVRAAAIAPVFDPDKQLVRLAGAANEVVSFQVNLAAPPGGLSSLRLSVSDLESTEDRRWGVRPTAIDRQSIEMFRVLSVRVARLPGWHQLHETAASNRFADAFPDALVPIDHPRLGQPWRLEAGQSVPVWIDVPIPADAQPGQYEGRLTVASANFAPQQIAIRLEVLPLVLPTDSALRLLCPIEFKQMLACELGQGELSDSALFSRAETLARKRMAQWIELGRKHHVQFLPADIAPIIKRDLDGLVSVDWAGYDRLVAGPLAGRPAPPVWLAPFRLDYPQPGLYGGLEGAAYADVASQYLRAIGRNFAAKQWPQPIVWVHRGRPAPVTLPYGAAHWADWLTERRRQESVTIGRLVRMVELNIGYFETLPWSDRPEAHAAAVSRPPGDQQAGDDSEAPFKVLPPHVTIYCPAAQFLAPSILPALRERQIDAWLGEGEPPWRPGSQVFARPEPLESLAYFARRYGMDTVWLGPAQRWPARSPLETPLDASEADFLFYAGHWFEQDRPVASLRLKFLRQAVQSAGYLKLLDEAGRGRSADAIAQAVVKYGLANASSSTPGLGGPVGWLTDGVLYADARAMLRHELHRSSDKPASAWTDQARFRWLQFHERTAWLRLGVYPGQLVDQLDSFGAPSGQMRAVFRLPAYADVAASDPRMPEESAGLTPWPTLVFGPLPATWKPTRHNVPVEPAPTRLALAGPLVALSADGAELPLERRKPARVEMPILLRGQGGLELTRLNATVPVAVGYSFARPPRIDGRLDDWPVATWYRAGDFHRLALPEPIGSFAQPPPPSPSWFMVGHDDANLYVAIACLGQKVADVTPRYSNSVQFDRGLLVGEDAVEVVLDPTGGRLDRQGLFRLVVKATGTVLGWRGLTGPDGTGQPAPWGQNVHAQVDFQPDYWSVEMTIPKADLGALNPHGLWRLNVARHWASRGEHSAWASACPYLTEPESLGNLLLRKPPLPSKHVPLAPVAPWLNW